MSRYKVNQTTGELEKLIAGASQADIDGAISDLISPTEVSPSASAYAVDDYLIYDGKLRKVKTAIEIGDALVEGTNIEQTTMMKELKTSGGGSSGGGTVIVPAFTVEHEERYPYINSPQGITITGLDTSKVNITGPLKSIAAGTYTVTLSLKDPSIMVWSDFTNTPRSYTYTVSDIYGVTLNETSTKQTRLEDAANFEDPVPAVDNGDGSSPFDNILPWSGMQIVEDEIAGTLVSIPKYYYKIEFSTYNANNYDERPTKIYISPTPHEGFSVSPAHADRGDGQGERDIVYIGRYRCAADNYKSTTGTKFKLKTSRDTFRTNIHNFGEEYWQQDYAMFWTIRLLYLVEYADWDSQDTLGYGSSSTPNTNNVSGYTDNMLYHTGTNASTPSNRSSHFQYRHIEDLYGWFSEFIDGLYTDTYRLYFIYNPSNFSATSGGVYAASYLGFTSGASTRIDTFYHYYGNNNAAPKWLLFPRSTTSEPSTMTYDFYKTGKCDSLYYSSMENGAVKTRGYGDYYRSGLFGLVIGASGDDYTGSRLQKLPNNS